MKKFNVRRGNFMKSKNSTTNMMYNLLIALIPIIIFTTYKNGIYPAIKGYGNLYSVFRPLIFASLPSLFCLLTEYLYFAFIKHEKKSIYYLFSESYAIIPGVLLGLIIPLGTPLWLLIIGSIIASLSKMLMGGLGKNKLNPALTGSLFITIIFASLTSGYLNAYELDTISSATPLSNMTASSYTITYNNLVSPYGNLWNFFFGNIPGAVGETCSLLCLVAFIYLVITKVIKWRIPVSYIGTITIISLIICLIKNVGPWFILFNLLSGGLLFGAVFMATDPVTTPIGHLGQIISGIIMGILTMFIRYLTPLPEGVLISILIVNVLTILINYLNIKLYSKKIVTIIILTFTIIAAIISSFVIASKITTKPLDDTYQIISKNKTGIITTYEVSGRGYSGNNSLKLKIIFTGNDISNIEILKSHETYTKIIYDNNYLEKIISSQDNLNNLDTISGCTYTSKYLKEIISKTKEDYFKSK